MSPMPHLPSSSLISHLKHVASWLSTFPFGKLREEERKRKREREKERKRERERDGGIMGAYAQLHLVKRTKRNHVVRIVREHYLRDDLVNPLSSNSRSNSGGSGSGGSYPFHGEETTVVPVVVHGGKEVEPSGRATRFVVPDASCFPYQVDLLERGGDDGTVTGVVLLSSVLTAVRRLRGDSAKRRVLDLVGGCDELSAAGQKGNGRFVVFPDEYHVSTSLLSAAPVRGEKREESEKRAFVRTCKWLVEDANSNSNNSSNGNAMELDDGGEKERKASILVAVSDDSALREFYKSSLQTLVSSGLVRVLSTEEWITESHPQLLDLVALTSSAASDNDRETGSGSISGSGASFLPYKEHLGMSLLERKIKLGEVFQGKLKCTSRYSPWKAVVNVRNKEAPNGSMEVKIAGRVSLNRAMDGDIVAVELVEREVAEQDERNTEKPLGEVGIASVAENDIDDDDGAESTKYARVVGIVRRAWSDKGYCGSIQPKSLPQSEQLLSNPGRAIGVLFQPSDRRLPLIRMRTRQASVLKDQRIVVVIDSWERNSAFPNGHYVRALGMIGDRETETKVILHQHDVADPDEGFSPAVHACVPELPWHVPETIEDAWRRDIRSMCVFSVDPPGCKDIDDALSARFVAASELKESSDPMAVSLASDSKLVELGVHIADVTQFLKPNTPMDLEASKRCTSVYLVDRRIDMLPKPLTEDICSLRSGVDRYAFSVLWRVNVDTADVVGEPEFFKSVIHSKAALTYQEAQMKIDEGGKDIITTSLLLLRDVTRKLRQKRVDLGALTLASPEVKFEIDTETHDPLDVGMYKTRETNKMVEEMMLLANETVATCIFEKGFSRSALLRRHPVPTQTMFEPLIKACKAAGIDMDVTTSKSLADSLDAAGVKDKDSYLNTLIRFMATRCMTQAEYFSSGEVAQSQFNHYGLAMPIYTHFTSPIRRYADVVVHRMLGACIGLEAPSEQLCESSLVTEQCEVLNVRHRNAQMAGRASAELYTLVFFRDRPSEDSARVVKVREKGVIVFIPKYGIEGPIKLESWTKAAEKPKMTSPDGSKTLHLFDKVQVRIEVQQEGQSRQEHLVLSLV